MNTSLFMNQTAAQMKEVILKNRLRLCFENSTDRIYVNVCNEDAWKRYLEQDDLKIKPSDALLTVGMASGHSPEKLNDKMTVPVKAHENDFDLLLDCNYNSAFPKKFAFNLPLPSGIDKWIGKKFPEMMVILKHYRNMPISKITMNSASESISFHPSLLGALNENLLKIFMIIPNPTFQNLVSRGGLKRVNEMILNIPKKNFDFYFKRIINMLYGLPIFETKSIPICDLIVFMELLDDIHPELSKYLKYKFIKHADTYIVKDWIEKMDLVYIKKLMKTKKAVNITLSKKLLILIHLFTTKKEIDQYAEMIHSLPLEKLTTNERFELLQNNLFDSEMLAKIQSNN